MQRLLNIIACAMVGFVAIFGLAIYLTQRTPSENNGFVARTPAATKIDARQRVVAQRPRLPESAPDTVANGRKREPDVEAPVAPHKQYILSEVDAELDRLRSDRKARPEASDDLAQWYERLGQPTFTQSQNYAEHIAKLAKWSEESPQSPTPLIALAKSHIDFAWEARGTGYAGTVTEEGGKRIAAARKLLEQAIDLGMKDGEAHASLITVSMAEGWPLTESRRVLDAGRKLDPLYYRMYTAMALNLLPRGHGAPGDVEKLAAETAASLTGEDGAEAYGRIAASIDCLDRTLRGATPG